MKVTEDNHFFKQRDKYKKRASKFLVMGGASIVATMGALAAMPVLGAIAVPVLVATTGAAYVGAVGFGANKIAERTTDAYEPYSKREKVFNAISSLREKAFGNKNSHKNKLDL